MKDVYYYTSTMIFYVVIVIGSIFIPGVDEIFELVGVICVNSLAFLFPAVFYLTAAKRAHSKQRTETLSKFDPSGDSIPKRNKCLEFTAWLQLIGGICAFSAGMYNKVNQIFFSEHHEE
jgi:amino acid permease